MTKTSILCYEKNSGSCRNRVSLANNYICGAGHSGSRQSGASPSWQKVAPAINLTGMSVVQKRSLAWDTSTPPETLAGLARDEDWATRRAVAGNSSASPDTLAKLTKDKDKDEDVCRAVAENSSASPDTHIYLAEQGYIPHGFARGKSIDELIKGVHLVDQYPATFGKAYLNRLTYAPISRDDNHPKRRALISYVYAKYAESDEASHHYIQFYKDRIKALFPDDQEMAEMIGY